MIPWAPGTGRSGSPRQCLGSILFGSSGRRGPSTSQRLQGTPGASTGRESGPLPSASLNPPERRAWGPSHSQRMTDADPPEARSHRIAWSSFSHRRNAPPSVVGPPRPRSGHHGTERWRVLQLTFCSPGPTSRRPQGAPTSGPATRALGDGPRCLLGTSMSLYTAAGRMQRKMTAWMPPSGDKRHLFGHATPTAVQGCPPRLRRSIALQRLSKETR